MEMKDQQPDRSHLLTEQRLADSMNLDRMPTAEALKVMNDQDERAAKAVRDEAPNIERAIEITATAFSRGGRLIYIGAGTSGRLGVLDAAECPPTFSSDPEMVRGIIAGGEGAMFRSAEGAEDRREDGAAAVDQIQAGKNDVVCGIAAGGTTPYVRGAMARATQLGASTIFICCVQPNAGQPEADVVIRALVGPEVLTGSTRLKAGTATKLILNQITTLAMVRIGKVYENLMVDLRASNAKLRDRSLRIVKMITGLEHDRAVELLQRANANVKIAVVMHRKNTGREASEKLLSEAGGNLRKAME